MHHHFRKHKHAKIIFHSNHTGDRKIESQPSGCIWFCSTKPTLETKLAAAAAALALAPGAVW